jgi:hypothetical protein
VTVSAFIGARVAAFSAETPERFRWHAPYVADFGALPLYVGWTETIGIRPDGQVVRWSTEDEYAGVRSVEEGKWMLSALVAGTERYPELRALLPERPRDAVDCQCRNHPLFGPGKVLCGSCGGVGWLVPESQAEPPATADGGREAGSSGFTASPRGRRY